MSGSPLSTSDILGQFSLCLPVGPCFILCNSWFTWSQKCDEPISPQVNWHMKDPLKITDIVLRRIKCSFAPCCLLRKFQLAQELEKGWYIQPLQMLASFVSKIYQSHTMSNITSKITSKIIQLSNNLCDFSNKIILEHPTSKLWSLRSRRFDEGRPRYLLDRGDCHLVTGEFSKMWDMFSIIKSHQNKTHLSFQ